MKKITPVLFLAFLYFGCGQTQKAPLKKDHQPVHARNNAPLFQYGNPALLQYDRYLAGLDTQSAEVCHQAIDTFKLLFKKQPAGICDTAFFIFNRFQDDMTYYLTEHSEEDSANYYELFFPREDSKKPPLTAKQKAVKNRLDRNGFGLGEEAGEVFVTQNQHFLTQQFSTYVSTPMKQYLLQLEKEQKEGFTSEGGLIIDAPVLAGRTVWWEQFSKANPHFIYSKEAVKNYDMLLYILMDDLNSGVGDYHHNDSGLNNTVKLSDYFKEAWTYVQQKHPQSGTNAIVTPYFNAWQKMDTTEITRELNKFKAQHPCPWPH